MFSKHRILLNHKSYFEFIAMTSDKVVLFLTRVYECIFFKFLISRCDSRDLQKYSDALSLSDSDVL